MFNEHDDLSEHPDFAGPEWNERITRIEKEYSRRQSWGQRKHKLRTKLPIIAVIAVVVGLLAVWHETSGAVGLQSSATPTTTATSRAPETVRVNLNMPFLNTPAANWADGADGFQPPAAEPVGGFDAGAVSAAYTQVRGVMIAQRLDRTAMAADDPGPALALFAPKFRDDALQRTRDNPDDHSNYYVTALAPGTQLLPSQPKVKGSMTAGVDVDGNLVVHTNYIVAYAFDPGNPQRVRRALDLVAVVRWEVDYSVVSDTRRYSGANLGLWLDHGKGDIYSMDCAWSRKGFLAPTIGAAQGGGTTGSGHDSDYYFDPNHPLPQTDGCK
ncbi:MAG: hypothetical protein JWN03_4565 [Nocardia sp.]|uniref:hypothetical protein n=1 Tax=Nocardia sp. TaxID=1821 RepID=UPI00261B4ECB|nr:hypothetical protein [Nocardia sp.]MCU1644290.1 hypothetical protein [Nocardia sp.]